jgi:hypothetical protein
LEALAFALIIIAVLFIIEIYEIRKTRHSYDYWASVAKEFIDGFDSVKEAVNHNAQLLSTAQGSVDALDKHVAIMSTVMDLHTMALNINPNLTEKLNEKGLKADQPQVVIVDDD